MKTVLFFAIIVLTSILTGCQKENNYTTEKNPEPLNITTNIAGQVQTRATIASFPNGAKLGLFITSGNIGSNYNGVAANANVCTTLSGSSWRLEKPVYLSPAPATVFAYYPYSSSVNSGQTVPVEHISQTDYLYGSHTPGQSAINSSNPTVNLTMNHALSLIRFNFSKTNYTGSGIVTKIEIANKAGKTILYSAGKMNIQTGAITPTVSQNQPVVITVPATIPMNISILVLPVTTATSSSGDIQFHFTIDNKIYTYNVPASTKWEQGKVNTYTVTLSGTELNVGNVIIKDWGTGVNGSAELN